MAFTRACSMVPLAVSLRASADLNFREKCAVAILIVLVFFMGLVPMVFLQPMSVSTRLLHVMFI